MSTQPASPSRAPVSTYTTIRVRPALRPDHGAEERDRAAGNHHTAEDLYDEALLLADLARERV